MCHSSSWWWRGIRILGGGVVIHAACRGMSWKGWSICPQDLTLNLPSSKWPFDHPNGGHLYSPRKIMRSQVAGDWRSKRTRREIIIHPSFSECPIADSKGTWFYIGSWGPRFPGCLMTAHMPLKKWVDLRNHQVKKMVGTWRIIPLS